MQGGILTLIFGIYARLFMWLLSASFLFTYLMMEIFVPKKQRGNFWRHGAQRVAQGILKIARIKVHSHHAPHLLKEPTVIFANHASFFDPFILFSHLATETIFVTMPLGAFPFPFNIIFRKMEVIDVLRNRAEEKKYTHGHTRKQTVLTMITMLRQGKHVVIFPEGHIERIPKLYYMHTGAARAALRAHAPLLATGIVGMDHIVIDSIRMRPGHVHLFFGSVFHGAHVSATMPFRKDTKLLTKRIAHTLTHLLPHRYLPNYIAKPQLHAIAAFIDIDRTLYNGYVQKDFIRFAIAHGVLSWQRVAPAYFFLALEKMGCISHENAVRRAFHILRGLPVKKVTTLAKRFFSTKGIKKINDRMMAFIKNHQEENHPLILVTEVFTPLAEEFKKYIGAQAALATKLETKDGIFTGNVLRLCVGREKVHEVELFAHINTINLHNSYAYGDSVSDIAMLRIIGNPRAIRPQKGLRNYAQKHRWKIVQ